MAIFLCVFCVQQARAEKELWDIPQKKIPIPATASETIQKFLMSYPVRDIETVRKKAPQSRKDWVREIEATNTALETIVKKYAQYFSVSIKRAEIEGVVVRYITPPVITPKHREHLFVHTHGGGYVFGRGHAGVGEAILIAAYTKMPVLSIDYRMPPADPFPAALEDVVTVYKALLKDRPAHTIALGGSSAGGGLTLATIHKLIALGVDVPAALFVGAPWADLTKTSDSLFVNEGLDHTLITYDGAIAAEARLYAGNNDMKDPFLSPVYGDFAGFPPAYLVSGTRDLLLSDTVRVHRKLRMAGVKADLNIYEGLSHLEYNIVIKSPESRQVYTELALFLAEHLQ